MTHPGHRTEHEPITLTLTAFQVAYLRRLVFADLAELATEFARQTAICGDWQNDSVVGDDAQSMYQNLLGDVAGILDVIGWSIFGDTKVMCAHDRARPNRDA